MGDQRIRTWLRHSVCVAIVLLGMGRVERLAPAALPLAAKLESAPGLSARTAVLVAIDGVRWQEVFEGVDPKLADKAGLSRAERLDAAHLVPNLHRLMTAEGAAIGAPGRGAPIAASGPNFVSLPGYMEMLTGRTDTGCRSNACGDVPFATIVDDVTANGGIAAAVASWPGIEHAAATLPERALLSIGRHGGHNRGAFSEAPELSSLLLAGEATRSKVGEPDFRSDDLTGRLAAAFLAARRPNFLFVGLGETDEYAHQGDYRGYLNALREADAIVGRLAQEVALLEASGRPATLMVTADHGRSSAFSTHGGEHPESARTWLVAAGSFIRARGRTETLSVHHLSDVAPTLRHVLGLPRVDAAVAGAGVELAELFAPADTSLAGR